MTCGPKITPTQLAYWAGSSTLKDGLKCPAGLLQRANLSDSSRECQENSWLIY